MYRERINWPLLVMFVGLPIANAFLSTAPAQPPDPPPARLTSAAQVPAGNLVLSGESVGVVVERGEPPADARDQTPTVRVLVLRGGTTGAKRGEVLVLGGIELVADLGPLEVTPQAPFKVGK